MVIDLDPKINFVPAEVLLVEKLDTLKVLADPLRLRIRELMETPTTVKLVAEALDIPATKLYYHINLLEKHSLIILVNTRIVSGIIEKHYQITAKTVKVAKHLLSTGEDPEGEGLNLAIGTLLDSTREELLESVRANMVEWDDEGERHKGLSLHMGTLNLTEQQAVTFYAELETLVARYQDISMRQSETDTDDLNAYRALYLLFPKKKSSTS